MLHWNGMFGESLLVLKCIGTTKDYKEYMKTLLIVQKW